MFKTQLEPLAKQVISFESFEDFTMSFLQLVLRASPRHQLKIVQESISIKKIKLLS